MSPLAMASILAAAIVCGLLFGLTNLLVMDKLIEIANRGLPEGKKFYTGSLGPWPHTAFYARLVRVWREKRKSN